MRVDPGKSAVEFMPRTTLAVEDVGVPKAVPVRPNAMLSRRCAEAVISANWWDSGRHEHLVSHQLLTKM